MNTIEHPRRELSNIRGALYGKPWAITEDGFRLMASIAEAHIAGNPPEFEAEQKTEAAEKQPLTFEQQYGFSFKNDVAIIPVSGPIFPKSNLFTRLSGATSLQGLSQKLDVAQSLYPSAIILDFDSPGGSVSGLSEFCSQLFSMTMGQGGKCPIIGLVNDLCASAAYMMGSQCDALYSVDGGVSGSIGVLCVMDNWDRADKNAGNDPVIIKSHELKGIGYGAMTPNQQAEMQRTTDAYFSKFKEAVTRGRPQVNLDEAATGQTWMANPANDDDSAQDMDLIDGLSTLESLIQQFGN